MGFRWISLLATVGIFAALALPALASAGPKAATPELIERAANEGRVQRDTATLYLAYALGRPAKLPAAYRSDTPWDGTLPLRALRAAVPRMKSGPKREEAEKIINPAAPPGSGASCSTSSTDLATSTSTTHFYVEYGTLDPSLSISDYTVSLEEGWTTEVDSFGWAAPPVAPTPAPGSKYHVRIDNLGNGLYGFVSNSGTYAGPVGNNPNTAWDDVDAQASCMVLNRDYTGFPSTPQASLDSTTAHEFNHSLQYGYGALNGANTPDAEFVEGGATWMEDEVQDAANDNYNYLWPTFSDSMGDYDASPYAYWITFRGLTERYGAGVAGGGEQVMQDFWEETSKNTGNNLTAIADGAGEPRHQPRRRLPRVRDRGEVQQGLRGWLRRIPTASRRVRAMWRKGGPPPSPGRSRPSARRLRTRGWKTTTPSAGSSSRRAGARMT